MGMNRAGLRYADRGFGLRVCSTRPIHKFKVHPYFMLFRGSAGSKFQASFPGKNLGALHDATWLFELSLLGHVRIVVDTVKHCLLLL